MSSRRSIVLRREAGIVCQTRSRPRNLIAVAPIWRGFAAPSVQTVRGIAAICKDSNVQVLAEGIETKPERDFLRSEGVELMQGYLFAKLALEAIGVIDPSAWD